ncbi:hypothetical protein J6590_077233 [Homalodisca vitripennis]|nr:hypothetical protein J6590_077233 [Homalodisca vitripennis]
MNTRTSTTRGDGSAARQPATEQLHHWKEQYIGYNNDVEVNYDDFEEVIEEQFSNSEAISEEQAEGNGEDQAVGIEEREREEAAEGDGWE